MSKKISIEIRQKVLTLLKQGARSFTISKQLGLARISVENWQAAFDRGDVSWSLDNSWRKELKPWRGRLSGCTLFVNRTMRRAVLWG